MQVLGLILKTKMLDFAVDVVTKQYEEGARWLVYCDDTAQLGLIRDELKKIGHRPLQYYSAMAFSKEATIERFEKLGGILLSIRCLDEGIDIPSLTHALLLASSVNPRQHLQRRGRVLRTADGKLEATIYDALVQPDAERPKIVFDQDLDRAYQFGADADNVGAVNRRLSAFTAYSDAGAWSDFEDEDVGKDVDQ